MPTLQQVRDKVDAWLLARWAFVVARQATYYANNGHYWQGLRTHVGHVDYDNSADGERMWDNENSSPTDQAVSWLTTFPELAVLALPAVFIMDVYENESGHGWVLSVYARYNGTIYTRARNGAGDETSRTYDWRVYESLAL